MLKSFHIFTLILVSVAMALALAHALEFPGKMRLSHDAYATVQQIYYPGFTFGGLVGELGGMLALVALLWLVPTASPRFWWVLAAFALLVSMHLIYWLVTHQVNRFWLTEVDMSGLGATFFSFFSSNTDSNWIEARNIWEYSHLARAVFGMLSLIAMSVSLTVKA